VIFAVLQFRGMGQNNNQETENSKKTKIEYLRDVVNILKAAQRLMAYTFKIAPVHTAGVIVTYILFSILPFVNIWLNSRVIDELIGLVTGGAVNKSDLIYYVVIILGLFIFSGVIGTISSYFLVNYYFVVAREFGHKVTTKMAYLDVQYYEDPEINDLLQKVRENYEGRPQNFMDLVFWLIGSIIEIISGVVILIGFSPLMVGILLITSLPQLVNNVIFGRRQWGIWGAKGEVKRDFGRSREHLTSEHSLMELKVFKTRPYLLQRTYNLFANFQKDQIKIEKKRSLFGLLLDLISAIGFGAIFWVTVLAVVAERITIGQFNFYISSARNVQQSFGGFFRNLSRAYEHGLYVVDIFRVLDLEPKIVSGDVKLSAQKTPPLIEFKNVSFVYPNSEKTVIDDLSLTLKPGEHLAIVGENGAGKTTLIKLLMRFYDVTDGAILVDGVNIKDLDLESWYEKVGTLFQEFNTYHFDAKTNIGVGDTSRLSDLPAIVEAAKNSEAHEFIEKYEYKYDQVLDKAFKNGIRPSWGQWQRIALARAFFKDAPILILDEPTSAIDPKAEFEIFERLFDFAKGKTVIIISHRFSTVRNAQRIIVLEEGKIVEDGSHEKLLQLPNGKYRHAFELQRKGYE